MAKWEPATSFEEEVLLLQPNHNFIFGELCKQEETVHYPRPKEHLEYVNRRVANKRRNNQNPRSSSRSGSGITTKLDIIETVQRIAGTKRLDELPTVEDWDKDETVEQETVALMRHCGFGPSIDHALDEQCTRGSTAPKFSTGMHIMNNGRIVRPLFYDEKYFKMDDDIPELPISADQEVLPSPSAANSDKVFDDSMRSSDSFKTAVSTTSSYASALNELNLNDDDSYLETPKFIHTRNWYRSREAVENDRKQHHSPLKK